MNDPMSLESQTAHIKARFQELFKRPFMRVDVRFTDAEEIVVSLPLRPNNVTFLMELGSDDDRYRFELWDDGRDTGIYVEFAFPGETL